MKIAIIKLSALGDIVHGSIVLQFIKKHIPNSSIHWVCDERFADILNNHEHIDKLIKVKLKDKKFKESFRILKEAKKNDYDIAIDFQGLLKSAIVGRILCKNVVGFDKKSTREGIASLFYKKSFAIAYGENIIIRNLKLASLALNFELTKKQIENKIPCFENLKKQTPKNEPKKIMITVGSSWKSKIYPTPLHVEFINLLKDYEIYLSYGNEFEKELTYEISSKTHAKILEKTSLTNVILKMNEFDLIIGPDSGITHLAWAQNIPSITLFGPTPSHRNTYQSKKNVIIDSGKEIDARNLDKFDDCIKMIDPKLIAKKAEEILWI